MRGTITNTATGTNAIEWARANCPTLAYRVALDNHEPTREYAYGECHPYTTESGIDAMLIRGAITWRDGANALYLIDNGRTVTPMYVAAYHPEHDYVIVHAMPTNYNADGTRRTRPDNGRDVHMDNWQLGPRRAYHLKVSS